MSNRAHTLLLWAKVLFLPKNPKSADFLQKSADINKVKKTLVLKGVLSETIFVCVHTHQIWSFQHNSIKFQTGDNFSYNPTPQNKLLKSPPGLGLTNMDMLLMIEKGVTLNMIRKI